MVWLGDCWAQVRAKCVPTSSGLGPSTSFKEQGLRAGWRSTVWVEWHLRETKGASVLVVLLLQGATGGVRSAA